MKKPRFRKLPTHLGGGRRLFLSFRDKGGGGGGKSKQGGGFHGDGQVADGGAGGGATVVGNGSGKAIGEAENLEDAAREHQPAGDNITANAGTLSGAENCPLGHDVVASSVVMESMNVNEEGRLHLREHVKSGDEAAMKDNIDTVQCLQGVCRNASPKTTNRITEMVPQLLLRNVTPQQPSVREPCSPGMGSGYACKKPEHVKVNLQDLGAVSDDGVTVSLNYEAIKMNMEKLEKALVGKLIGKKLPFTILSSQLKCNWGHFGEFQIVLVGMDCFTCIFDTAESRDAVLMEGPWYIGGHIIGLDKWSASFSPKSMKGLSSPVWVRLPQLPLLYWDNKNIALIASVIGEPLWIDAHTCEWGRSTYARVCVRLDLLRKLPTGVWVPGVQGRFFQPVQYEGISVLCFQCGIVGHKENQCPTRANEHGGACARPRDKPHNNSAMERGESSSHGKMRKEIASAMQGDSSCQPEE